MIETFIQDRCTPLKLVPGVGVAVSLLALLRAYQSADAAYRSAMTADPGEGHDNEWDAKENAQYAFLYHPCESLADVRLKAKLVLDDENVFDGVRNCSVDDTTVLHKFLRSLLGEELVGESSKGGN